MTAGQHIQPDSHPEPWPAWATEPVEIVAPQATWLLDGAREAKELAAILAPFEIEEVQHIGSTSIPNLPAKPILDLMARTTSFDKTADIAAALAPFNWNYVPPELDRHPERRFFVRVQDNRRIAHLHLLSYGSQRWQEQLYFRDALTRNPELSIQYATLKTGLSRKYRNDREAYTEAKAGFIATVLAAILPTPDRINPNVMPTTSTPTVQLIFATNNPHKVEEIQSAIGQELQVISLREAGIDIDIPEPHDTLEANASEKSGTIHRLTGQNCFSEDTGLEVTALNGEPGVKSARYAGEDRAFDKNVELLLHKLEGNPDRRARFRTVISLILDGQEHLFEGTCEGRILTSPAGDRGFGYDPVFSPDGEERSFAQMSLEEKNHYSHRRKAADQLVKYLRKTIHPA